MYKILSTAKAFFLLAFTNLFSSIFLWSAFPFSQNYLDVSAIFWLLSVPLFTWLLFFIAWKSGAGAEHRSKLTLLDDLLYSLLMVEAGLFFGVFFLNWTFDIAHRKNIGIDVNFAAGGLAVFTAMFVTGVYIYLRNLEKSR